jgi:LemA protein
VWAAWAGRERFPLYKYDSHGVRRSRREILSPWWLKLGRAAGPGARPLDPRGCVRVSGGVMGWIVLLLVIGLALVFISTYNRLITARNAFRNAFAQIDVQLTRRYDLIPNLVEIAKGYIKHERETLEAVIRARNSAYEGLKVAAADPANAAAVQQLSGADQQLGGALGRLMAVAEAYPDLKANQTMMQLSEELTSTENKVAFARQAYNDAVLTYNNDRETFPSNIASGMFGFQAAQPLEIAKSEAREAPKVSFT